MKRNSTTTATTLASVVAHTIHDWWVSRAPSTPKVPFTSGGARSGSSSHTIEGEPAQHHGHAERADDDGERAHPLADGGDGQAFLRERHRADDDGGQRDQHGHAPAATRPTGDHHRTDHHVLALGEVVHLGDVGDDHEPKCDERVDAPDGQPREEVLGQIGEVHGAVLMDQCAFAASRRPSV